MKMLINAFALVFLCSNIWGCTTYVRVDNTQELMEHPEFEMAVKTTPNFVDAAFRKITSLERTIETGQY